MRLRSCSYGNSYRERVNGGVARDPSVNIACYIGLIKLEARMARDENCQAIYDVAEQFRDRCLKRGHSLLWPEDPVWTMENLASLREAFMDNLDKSDRTFLQKLHDQIANCDEDVHKVAADVMALYFLPIWHESVGEEVKSRSVNQVISWKLSGEPPNLDLLGRAFSEEGLLNPGVFYMTGRPWQIAYYLRFAEEMLRQGVNPEDVEACKQLADHVLTLIPKNASASREIILHLLFPEQFEDILTNDKEAIAEAFKRYAGTGSDVDDALYNIREELERQKGRPISFYQDEDIWEQWHDEGNEGGGDDESDSLDAIANLLATRRLQDPEILPANGLRSIVWPITRPFLKRVAKSVALGEGDYARGAAAKRKRGSFDRWDVKFDGIALFVSIGYADDQGELEQKLVWGASRWGKTESAPAAAALLRKLEAPGFTFRQISTVDAVGFGGTEVVLFRSLSSDELRAGDTEASKEGHEHILTLRDGTKASGRHSHLEGDNGNIHPILHTYWATQENPPHDRVGPPHGAGSVKPIGPILYNGEPGVGMVAGSLIDEIASDLRMLRERIPNTGTDHECPTFLVGADDTGKAAARILDRVADGQPAAMWWSYPVTDERKDVASACPYLYVYASAPTAKITHRFHFREYVTKPGNTGMISPWPEFTLEEERSITSGGPTQNLLFKTWFLVDSVEALDPPLTIQDVERPDGVQPKPSDLLGGFAIWRRKIATTEPHTGAKTNLRSLAEATNMNESALQEMLDLLVDKPQLILEGPPGSGKTFVGRLLGRYLTDNPLAGPVDSRLTVVQFHQSYGYEDFIEGIRPDVTLDGQVTYSVSDGVFKRICERAATAPSTERFVIVVDEINRGNISRIFGELLLLLEYRRDGLEVTLPYSHKPFVIPENVHIIATMNTTDRSLALIDYALRRRFYFYGLTPVEKGRAPVLERWLAKSDVPTVRRAEVLKLFIALNEKVQAELDEHHQVGHSYFMTEAIRTDEGLRRIWDRGVMPLLEEYFYNRPKRAELLEAFSPERLLVASVPAPVAPPDEPPPDA